MLRSKIPFVMTFSQQGGAVGSLLPPSPVICGPPRLKAPPDVIFGPPPLKSPPDGIFGPPPLKVAPDDMVACPPFKAPPDDTVGRPPFKAPPHDIVALPSKAPWLQRPTDGHRVKESPVMVRPVQTPSVKVLFHHGEDDQDRIPPRPPLSAPPDGRSPLKAHPSQSVRQSTKPLGWAMITPHSCKLLPVDERPPWLLPTSAITPDDLEEWEMLEMENIETDGYDRRGWKTVIMSRCSQVVPRDYYQKSFFFWSFVCATECAVRWRRRGFLAEIVECFASASVEMGGSGNVKEFFMHRIGVLIE